MNFKDPYEVEKKRQLLASNKEFDKLKKLYRADLPEIKDINSSKFWDERYNEEQTFEYQDRMTKDRVKTAVNFIPTGKLKILDIGAGYGWAEELIGTDKDKSIYANDISETAVNYLNGNFKGHFSKQSIYTLKYKKDLFDIALVLEVLEHIPPSKIFSVLQSINKLLKIYGRLIISVPLNEGLEDMKGNPNGHVRMYTKDLIFAELELSGFVVQDFKELYAFSRHYKIKKLLAEIGLDRWRPNNIIIRANKV